MHMARSTRIRIDAFFGMRMEKAFLRAVQDARHPRWVRKPENTPSAPHVSMLCVDVMCGWREKTHTVAC